MGKINVENMDLYYGQFHALKNINLDIPEKKITAFIGPSGCGPINAVIFFSGISEQKRPGFSDEKI